MLYLKHYYHLIIGVNTMFFFFQFDDNSVPSFDQMMKPLLVALEQLGGKAELKELDAKTIEIMNLPENIVSLPHKGSANRTEVEYRLAWARTYLKKYGLLKNTARGVWSLSDSYDGKIDSIDTSEIARIVNQENRSKPQKNHVLSSIESALAFENLVLGIIKEQLQLQKKNHYSAYSDTFDFGYDLILPEGIDDNKSLTYCIIKYINPQNQNAEKFIVDMLQKIDTKALNDYLMLIVNITMSDKVRNKLLNCANEKLNISKIIIWDGNDLSNRMNPDSDYTKYYITPKQAIVEDTLTADPSDDEKQKIKQSYIEKIKQAYQNEDIVLFLGAGVSIDAGVPLWSGLIKKLLIHMINSKVNNRKLSEKETEMLNNLAYKNQENSPLTQMRYIKSAFTDEEYYELVHDVLYSRPLKTETKLLDALAKISAPQRAYNGIRSIVTYNFDDLLERKFAEKEIEFNTVYQEDDMAAMNKLNIYHVHGYLPFKWNGFDVDTNLIFSEEDYHKVYRDAFSWSNLTQLNAFRDSTCLFIGCSLTDPNLRRLLDVAARNKESSRHYAILPKNKLDYSDKSRREQKLLALYERIDDNIREGYFRELGLNIVWIDSFDEIPDILLNLRR